MHIYIVKYRITVTFVYFQKQHTASMWTSIQYGTSPIYVKINALKQLVALNYLAAVRNEAHTELEHGCD
jgi:hypothetical protein